MCFHTSQTQKVVALEKRYKVQLSDNNVKADYDAPKYHLNGFAHPQMLIIPQEASHVLAPALWGVVPPYKKPEQISAYYKEAVRYGGGINAQSEKLFDHFIYKESALTRRCIIPVTGFFEPHTYKTKKYPFYIKSKIDDVLSLAGLYTLVGRVPTFTILTKEASPLFAKIHNKKNRQPVILQKDYEGEWLKNNLNQNDVQALLDSHFKESALQNFTVSRDLFSPKVDSDKSTILEVVTYDDLPYRFM